MTKADPPWVSIAAAKQLATLRARAALAGAELVAIEADDGGAELLLTRGATTQRFRDPLIAHAAIRRDEART